LISGTHVYQIPYNLLRSDVSMHVLTRSTEGEVHPRTDHEGPEGGVDI